MSNPNGNAELFAFLGSGAALISSGLAFKAYPNRVNGIAFYGSFLSFYGMTQSQVVRNYFGNGYDKVLTAVNAINTEIQENPEEYWHPGRFGL